MVRAGAEAAGVVMIWTIAVAVVMACGLTALLRRTRWLGHGVLDGGL